MSHYSGRLVVLTGVAHPGQVGEALARAFAAEGARVVLLDRNGDAAAERAAELRAAGHDARGFGCDLTDLAAVAAVVSRISHDGGAGVDALVNAAGGFGTDGPVADTDPALLQRMLAVNLTTAFVTTRAFLPALRRARGAVLYFGSVAALPGASGAGSAAYAAAKSGVLALMRAVADEEAPHGVRANAIAPNSIRTRANEAAMGPGARFVERETVAEVALWLCRQPEVTGQVVRLG